MMLCFGLNVQAGYSETETGISYTGPDGDLKIIQDPTTAQSGIDEIKAGLIKACGPNGKYKFSTFPYGDNQVETRYEIQIEKQKGLFPTGCRKYLRSLIVQEGKYHREVSPNDLKNGNHYAEAIGNVAVATFKEYLEFSKLPEIQKLHVERCNDLMKSLRAGNNLCRDCKSTEDNPYIMENWSRGFSVSMSRFFKSDDPHERLKEYYIFKLKDFFILPTYKFNRSGTLVNSCIFSKNDKGQYIASEDDLPVRIDDLEGVDAKDL